jgi:hypothetical protein
MWDTYVLRIVSARGLKQRFQKNALESNSKGSVLGSGRDLIEFTVLHPSFKFQDWYRPLV